jgi:nitrogen fixation protein NifU and related proteins
MYSARLLEHFEHPRNGGEIANADAAVEMQNPACGDILRLTIKVEAGHISEIRFRAKGCVALMACGSALTELVKGKTPAQARELGKPELLRAVEGVPEASSHAPQLAIDALGALLKKVIT